MAQAMTTSVVRQIESLFDGGSTAGLSDRQLLERFAARRDIAGEAAFAAIVARHGPMVLGVCRQLLGDRHHAEDAFQAVFLVLARRARSVRDPDLLGNWLYGVALRTARKAKARLARIRRGDDCAMPCPEDAATAPADRALIDRERAEALHAEIDRLPASSRLPIVLCYFEGLSLAEAARRLRCPAGTVHSRLVRAREKLRRGLIRRGVVLPATMLAAALTPRSASASVSSLLCETTTRAAIAFAARHAAGGALAAPAAALAREVLRSMLIHKLKLAAMSVLLVATLAAGAGSFTRSPAGAGDEPRQALAAKPNEAPRPAPGRMLAVGRVLNPEGKPVPGASVMVYGELKHPEGVDQFWGIPQSVIGHAGSDGSGRFRVDAPRTTSSVHEQVGAVAIAPGYGAGWVDLDPDADEPAGDITLRPEQVIQGRLFDLQGRPARGVRVSVEAMALAHRDPFLDRSQGPLFRGLNASKDLPAWPRAAITDAEGRFIVRGVGRDLEIVLIADDPRFARQRIVVDTDGTAGSKQVTLAVEPAKVITGRVTYADTGQPVPHAILGIIDYREIIAYSDEFETDAEGRFRANPISADRYNVSVHVPEGQPYLNAWTTFTWTKGAIEHRVDLALRRGTSIRGKVVEEGTGRPVAGAMLRYMGRPTAADESGSWSGATRTGPDGSYQLPVLPDPGTLIVLGPSEDYVLREMSQRMILYAQPGGRRFYAHAFIPCELKAGTETREVNVTLRRGTTVKARVIGPDGQPVQEAWMFSRIILRPEPEPWRSWWGDYHGKVRNGRCELHGLPPDTEVPVTFLDARHNLGATILLSGRSAAGGPVTVRLQPCGTARARLVDPAGKPDAGRLRYEIVTMVVTPGPHRRSQSKADQDQLAADEDALFRIDPVHYGKGVVSDGQGQITLPALIPGATYRIDDTTGDPPVPRLRKEFTVKPGEALDLGDILVEKPGE